MLRMGSVRGNPGERRSSRSGLINSERRRGYDRRAGNGIRELVEDLVADGRVGISEGGAGRSFVPLHRRLAAR